MKDLNKNEQILGRVKIILLKTAFRQKAAKNFRQGVKRTSCYSINHFQSVRSVINHPKCLLY